MPKSIRTKIKEGLAQCTEGQRLMFCRMYAPPEYHRMRNDFLYNIEALAKYNIDEVVDKMPKQQLKNALGQIERTLPKK